MTDRPGVAIIVRTVRGLEWFAAAELSELLSGALDKPLGEPLDKPLGEPLDKPLGEPLDKPLGETLDKPLGEPPRRAARRRPAPEPVVAGRREVTVDLPALDPRLSRLGTADDVFVVVGRLAQAGPTRQSLPLIAAATAALDWDGTLARLRDVREVPRRPRFDVVASIEGRHTYNRYEVADAIGDALGRRVPGRYLARSGQQRPAGEPDLTVRVFVRDAAALVAVRLTGRPLHRRGYKRDTGAGTLHPPVAAALVRLAVPAGPAVIADPFCGDGTIAIEAGLRHPDARVLAADIDQARLDNAARNAERAGVRLTLARSDAGGSRWPAGWRPGEVDAVVTNPPWNVAVDARGALRDSLDRCWRRLPGLLGTGGRLAMIADARLDAADVLRRAGFRLAPTIGVRLAGRVSQILLCAPPGQPPPPLPDALAGWRKRAEAAGLVGDDGFT